MDLTKALRLLESQDSRTYADARLAITTQIDQGLGLKQLVNYYSDQRSERALDLLCAVREPHDKALLDQLAEIFPRQTLNTTILLGQILQQSPSWVPKIAFHELFRKVTNYCHMTTRKRSTRIVVEDIAVILFICSLLPNCSVLTETILKDLGKTFIYACEQLRLRMKVTDKTSNTVKDDVEEVHFSHLHYAVRQYFMTLYGVYPVYFVNFLNETFVDGDEGKQKIWRAIVEPMTMMVRLHPSLLTFTKKRELEQTRWHQREPHDFLHDVRTVMIGAIPASTQLADDGPPSEQEDTSTVLSDVYRTLFPSKSSGTTSNDGILIPAWDNGEDMADQEVERALMHRIDSPPGTRSHTPKGHKDTRTLEEPMVLDGKRRRSTGRSEAGDEKSRKSFRQTIGSIGKMFTRSGHRMNESFHEEVITGVEIDGPRRNSELEEAEDAMDAIDAERVETPHVEHASGSNVLSPVSVAAAAAAKKAEEARASARSLRGSMRAQEAHTPGAEEGHESTTHQKAPKSTSSTASGDDVGDHGVSRSRSTSFLTIGVPSPAVRCGSVSHKSTDLDHPVKEEGEDTETSRTGSADILLRKEEEKVGGISESLPDQRFSINHFFREHNRQRFRSECPPTEANGGQLDDEMDWGDARKKMAEDMRAFGGGGDGVTSNSSTLKRNLSCPNIVPVESRAEGAAADGEGGETGFVGSLGKEEAVQVLLQTVQTDGKEFERKPRRVKMVEYFPYLAMINEPCPNFFESLEQDLEDDHERNRDSYMRASNEFHTKLKELNMADRLPGKIYDDLGHILKGLPVEKQRDMLQARLSLVNQHLLYERSCRLLHANRNRRLFGRIKQQKVYESELRSYREREVLIVKEKQDMVNACMEYRKKEKVLQREMSDLHDQYSNIMSKAQKEMSELVRRTVEAETVAKAAMADRERFRAEHDGILRRAEDAEVELKVMEEKFETARAECAKLAGVAAQLEQAKDDLLIAERRRREETGGGGSSAGGATSPDWTGEDRLKELEGGLERSRAETERLRRELETLGFKKEESERALKSETSKSLEMRAKLDRAARLLNEQKEAAEQKYLSLQLVVRRQEEYIAELFSVVEEAEDSVRKDSNATRKGSSAEREAENGEGDGRERSADDSSLSEPVIRSPPRRSVLPDKCITDEVPSSFFLIDPLRAASAEQWELQESLSGLPSPDN